jgi:thiamine biosynthesis lipoprotein
MHPRESPPPLIETYGRPGSCFERFRRRALGTENVLLLERREGLDPAGAAREAFELIERLELRLSKFLPESELSLVNALAAGRPVGVGEELQELLRLSREAWELTGGAFDPTVGGLLRAWGFVDGAGRVPADAEIEALLTLRGMDHVELDPAAGTVRFDRPGVELDLGAIGKGYVADRAADLLQARGIAAGAVLSGRSSIVAWGLPPGEEGWRVELAHPEDPGGSLATLVAEPGAISSSGAYERRIRAGAREYGHVLDPRSGRPVERLKGATIWSPSALLGDVLSTALFVLGREALEPGGAVEKLARAWSGPGEEPRVSALIAESDPGAWGGVRSESFFLGRPGWR